MLANIDQWAFKVLLLFYGLLGIEDIPKVNDSEWTITERWTELPDQTYRLSLVSTNLANECVLNSSSYSKGFVLFPQTYMGQMKIYVDNKLIYTNSMSSFWNISQLMSKPLYSCAIFEGSKEVKVEITAYMKFFTSVTGMPEVKEKYPSEYTLYDEAFVIASVVSLFLGFVGAILIAQFSTLKEALMYLTQQAAFSLLVGSHVPGRYFDISLASAHTLVVVSGFLGLITLLLNTIHVKNRFLVLFAFLFLTLFPTICFIGYKNATHIMVFILIIMAFFGSLGMALYKLKHLRKEKDYTITALYILLFIIIILDGAGSQVKRDSYLHLSSIAFTVTTISFMKVLVGFNKQQKTLLLINSRLNSELKNINVITDLNNTYREVIHDIKSPIMSLSFLLSSDENNNMARSIGERLKSILVRIQSEKLSKVVDWYSYQTFLSKLDGISNEKRKIYPRLAITLKTDLESNIEIMYDPIDIVIILEELIDNSLKYSNGDITIKLNYMHEKFNCTITNHISESHESNALNKIGLGIGLMNVKKKIAEMSAESEIEIRDNEFRVNLKFTAREA